jgi:YidC/Oxa1 family membrane protein insertase
MQNQRNLIIAVVLTGLLLLGWDAGMRYFYPNTGKPAVAASASPAPSASASAKPTREGGLTAAADIAEEARDLKTALGSGGRVAIAAPGLSGSINLTGGLVDDLSAMRHTATVDKPSNMRSSAGPVKASQYPAPPPSGSPPRMPG